MTKPFRYYDAERELDESLADIKIAAPLPLSKEDTGLDRIATGNTALASVPQQRAAAAAAVPSELQKAELKAKLQLLLKQKKQKVAAFVEALKQAEPDPTVAPIPVGSPKAPERAQHQGPAANLLARALKEQRDQKQQQL